MSSTFVVSQQTPLIKNQELWLLPYYLYISRSNAPSTKQITYLLEYIICFISSANAVLVR